MNLEITPRIFAKRYIKEALADAHVELALEKAYLKVACEELDQPLEDFKKKQSGGRRTKR